MAYKEELNIIERAGLEPLDFHCQYCQYCQFVLMDDINKELL
jgi:hypothetical protein